MNHPSAGSPGEPPIGSPILGPAVPPRSSSDAPPARIIDVDLGPFVSGGGIPSVLPPAPQPTRAEAREVELTDAEFPWLVSPGDAGDGDAEFLDSPDVDRPPWESSARDETAYGRASSSDAEIISIDDLISGDAERARDPARETAGDDGDQEVDWLLARPSEAAGEHEAPSASLETSNGNSSRDYAFSDGDDSTTDPDSRWQPWAGLSAGLPDSGDEATDAPDADRESEPSVSGSWEQPEAEAGTTDVSAGEMAADSWGQPAELEEASADAGSDDPWGQQPEMDDANAEVESDGPWGRQSGMEEASGDAGTRESWVQPEVTDETAVDATTGDSWEKRAETEEIVPESTSSENSSESVGSENIAVPLSSQEVPDVSDVVLEEIASRLEQIARSLRSRDGGELSGDTSDPLEVLITGYALGYSEGVRRSGDDESHEH
ncbi:hypothetical protein BH23GEM8_BH23GEM8_12260 [soil metagenome]